MEEEKPYQDKEMKIHKQLGVQKCQRNPNLGLHLIKLSVSLI